MIQRRERLVVAGHMNRSGRIEQNMRTTWRSWNRSGKRGRDKGAGYGNGISARDTEHNLPEGNKPTYNILQWWEKPRYITL